MRHAAFQFVLVLVATFIWGALCPCGAQTLPEKKLPTSTPSLKDSQPVIIYKIDSAETRLLKERYNVAVEELQGMLKLFEAGKASLDLMSGSLDRLTTSKLALAANASERVSIWEQVVAFRREQENSVKAQIEAGAADAVLLSQAKYARLNAELGLLRAKQPQPVKR